MLDGWWVSGALASGGPALIISWVVVVIGSIVLHELGHGYTARHFGDDTGERLGHLTLNPIVHMGATSLICFALFGFAWGAMPVDPGKLRGRAAPALVLLAGPLVNVALAMLAALGGVLWIKFAGAVPSPMNENVAMFFSIATVLNVALAVFNMIPVMPLDGGRILAEFVPGYARLAYGENGQWLMLALFLLFFWFGAGPLFGIARFTKDLLYDTGLSLLSFI